MNARSQRQRAPGYHPGAHPAQDRVPHRRDRCSYISTCGCTGLSSQPMGQQHGVSCPLFHVGPCDQWAHTRLHSPLDAECQHNAIMALQRLLALVGGTCVPHLQRPESGGSQQDQPGARAGRVAMRREAILREKALPRRGRPAHGQCPPPTLPGPPRQGPTHLDGLIRGATEEQVPHGVDTETPDGALVAHEGSFALEDLLWVIGCRDRRGW